MEQASTGLNGELKNLKRDLGVLTEQVERAMAGQISQAREELRQMGDEGTEEIRTLLEQTNAQLRNLRALLQDKTQQVQKTVEDHPWASMLGAFGAGVVLGKLLDSRQTH